MAALAIASKSATKTPGSVLAGTGRTQSTRSVSGASWGPGAIHDNEKDGGCPFYHNPL